MKVQKFKIVNFKGLEEIDVELNGNSIVILGPNNVGKSSIIDGIFDTLQNNQMPPAPIKQGQDHAEIVVEVGEEDKVQYIVKKTFTPKNTNGYLSITTPDGANYSSPVEHLKKLFGTISFDMEDLLLSKNDKEMAKKLKTFLNIDTTNQDAEYKKAYDERTAVGRDIKTLEPLVIETRTKEIVEQEIENLNLGLKARPQLIEKQTTNANRLKAGENLIKEKELSISIANNNIKSNTDLIEQWKKQIAEAEEEIIINKKLIDEAKTVLKDAIPLKETIQKQQEIIASELQRFAPAELQITQLQNELKTIEKNEELKNQLKEKKEKRELLTKKVEFWKEEAAKIYQAASTEELVFTEDDGILYNGLPLDRKQINTAGLMKLALKLVIKSNPKFKGVRFDASFMDNNTYKECRDMINELGLQAFVEMVDKEATGLHIEIEEKL